MHFRPGAYTQTRTAYAVRTLRAGTLTRAAHGQTGGKEGAREDGIRDGISFMLYALWM